MKTADERFDYSVWFVLDKIREAMIPNKSEISYPFDINVKRIKPITFWSEKKAVDYLIAKKVIQKVGEPIKIESGNKGSTNYSIQMEYCYKISRKQFFKYYRPYQLKVFSKEPDDKLRTLIKKQIAELVESRRLGKKQAKLLSLLTPFKPISRSTLESKTKTKNLTALIRDTRKSIKSSVFSIELVRSYSFSKENAYKLIVISYL